MSSSTERKTVLVTGCSPGGIGHEICKAFHAKGLHVIATARNPAVLADLANQPGYTCLQLDVTDQASIDACRDEVVKLTGGKLDILVNNAGRTHTVPATDLDIADVRQTFETNVFGVMAMVKTFVAPLIAAKGLIINISSAASVVPYPFASAYSASKGAVNAFSRTLRLELRPYGVRVMVAITGTVRTNINLQVDRQLAPGSLYEPIRDVYQWRLMFSRETPTSVTPEAYATRLVADALRPEWWPRLPAWLRGLVSSSSPLGGFLGAAAPRPDWHYFGGLARLVWLGTCVGEWFTDVLIYHMFKLGKLESVLAERQGGEEAEAERIKEA